MLSLGRAYSDEDANVYHYIEKYATSESDWDGQDTTEYIEEVLQTQTFKMEKIIRKRLIQPRKIQIFQLKIPPNIYYQTAIAVTYQKTNWEGCLQNS